MAELCRSDIVQVDLSHGLMRKHVGSILATGDKYGNRFGAEIFRDGVPIDIHGFAVTGYFLRPNKDAIFIVGSTAGNTAFVTLPQACYIDAGSFTLALKISSEDYTTTVRIVDGYILLTQTDDLVDPGEAVPTLDDIFAQIAAMEAATERAQAATADAIAAKDNANSAAVNAVNIATEKGDQAIQLAQEEADKQNVKIATLTADIASNTAPPIIPTATGEVVSVSDSANRPLAGLRLYGKTTQDGVPTPNNPVPLVNVGAGGSIGAYARGKNLLPNTVSTTVNNGITFASNADGTIAADGTSMVDYDAYCIVGTASLEVGEKYILTGCPSGGGVSIGLDGTAIYDWGNGIEFTAETENYTAVLIVSKNKTVSGIVFSPMIRRASDANTIFEPYKDGGSLTASTPNGLPGIPVTSGGNYTDSNGQQWVCDEVDFGRGVDVQRIGVYQGEVQTSSTGANANGLKFVDFYDIPYDASCVGGIMCNALPVAPTPEAGWLSTEPCLSVADGRIRLYGVEGVTYMVNIFYAMQDHIETPLSTSELAAYRAMTSQKPTTTVYNDAGAGMQVDYIADTKNYIDNKLAAIAAATL